MRRAIIQRAGLAVLFVGGGRGGAADMMQLQQVRSGAGARAGAAAGVAAALPPPPPSPAARRPLPTTPTTPLLARASSSSSSSRSNNNNNNDGDDRDPPLPPPYKPPLRLSPPAPPPLALRRKWPLARRARRADPLAHHEGVRAALRTRGEVEVVLELPTAAEGGLLLGGGGGGGGGGPTAATSSSSSSSSPSSSSSFPRPKAERLAQQLSEDAPRVIELAVQERAAAAALRGERYVPPQVALASVVLCDDARMRELNLEHRGKDCPTDVLTLELRDRAVDRGRVRLPVRLLGDAIISLDTAERQARERRGLERRRREREREREGAGGGQEEEAAAAVQGKRRRRRAAEDGGGEKNKGFGGGAAKSAAAAAGGGDKNEKDGYTLLDELRVLLVHGALHLVGMDHEASEEEHAAMAAAERRLMLALGWRGSGLISAAEAEAEEAGAEGEGSGGGDSSSGGGGGGGREGGAAAAMATAGAEATTKPPPNPRSARAPAAAPSSKSSSPLFSTRPRIVALDMDGTLLNAQSRIDPASARVIRAASEERGVRVVLATGKARPAALAAARDAGLDPLLCSELGPGVFLQGLAVHGARGEPLSDSRLPPALVRAALLWAESEQVPLCCFLGDECATVAPLMGPELRELHTRYYEPLSAEYGGADALLERAAEVGGTRKLLFMTGAARVSALVEPYWRAELGSGGGASAAASSASGVAGGASSPSSSPFSGLADVTIAVPGMLEVVPRGVNKMVGLRALLAALGLSPEQMMAVGDGANDLEMVAGAGLGVAMGNGVEAVKRAAGAVVARHDEGGIVEAFERFVL